MKTEANLLSEEMELQSDTQPAQSEKGVKMWRFYVFSFIGILCFFVPVTIGGTNTILVDHVHLWVRQLLGPAMPYVALLLILAGAGLPIVRQDFKKSVTDFIIVLLKYLGQSLVSCMYLILVRHYCSNKIMVHFYSTN